MMFKESWRVAIWLQMDSCFNWKKIQDKTFETKEEALNFKSQYDKKEQYKTYLYHSEPSWVLINCPNL